MVETPASRESGSAPVESADETAAGYGRAFAIQLPYGYCVGVHIPTLRQAQILTQGPGAEPTRNPLAVSWPIPDRGLTADERDRARALRGYRRPDYIAGRLALRGALNHLGADADACTLGVSDRGAPLVPAGFVGSISHKRPYAIALAALDDGWTRGVDLERRAPTATDIGRRILTDEERRDIADLAATPTTDGAPGLDYKLAVIRRFSVKEAIYKAIDPFVQRYVGFKEVTVLLDAGPESEVAARPHLSPPPPRPLEIHARIIEFREYYISSARARPR